ncbi:MAG: M48 family metalloprotease [archaeon]
MGFFTNAVKTTILLALLTALVLWIGNLLGGTSGLIVAFVFVMVMNFVMFWWSHRIVLWMYKAKELPQGHRARKLVREIASRAGLPMPKVYIIESGTPNAFATGPTPKRAAVAVTNSILDLLDDNELRGVLAHEMSHVRNRDTLIQTIAAVMAGVISYVATMARWGAMFGGFGGDDDRGNGFLELLVLGILAPLIALLLQLALSRTREYFADESAAKLLHDGKGLSSALKKLEKANADHPFRKGEGSPATAPLFIVNPFRGSFIFQLFSTHPPIIKRTAKLDSMRF